MYICVCNRITDKDIKKAVSQGANSVSDLRDMLGVSNQCGTCIESAQEVLSESYQADPSLFYQVA